MTGFEAFQRLVPIRLPILQAPMAGVSTPELAAAACEAGGLGALGLGAASPEAARRDILALQALTDAPFNVNFFCHAEPERDAAREVTWIERARPVLAGFGATPPERLHAIYPSFLRETGVESVRLNTLLELRPAVVSFHFGLPLPDQIATLRAAGIVPIASATSLAEARQIERAGLDAVIAQGWEAGGHRGIFDPDAPDEQLSTLALTGQIAREIRLPVIAAGGIMDGKDIHAALSAGAAAAQLGTAFIGCPESAADTPYRERLAKGGKTVMTRAISGRPARCLANDITAWGADIPDTEVPAYPCTYDMGKALNAAARARGETGWGAQWSGAEHVRSRFIPAAALMAQLEQELQTGGALPF